MDEGAQQICVVGARRLASIHPHYRKVVKDNYGAGTDELL